MLFNPIHRNVNPISTPTISGRDLHRRRTKSQKAALVAQMRRGEVKLTAVELDQIAQIVGVSVPYVYRALALSPENRMRMRAGQLRMADVPVIPTKRKLDQTVKAAGVARTWDAIVPLLG